MLYRTKFGTNEVRFIDNVKEKYYVKVKDLRNMKIGSTIKIRYKASLLNGPSSQIMIKKISKSQFIIDGEKTELFWIHSGIFASHKKITNKTLNEKCPIEEFIHDKYHKQVVKNKHKKFYVTKNNMYYMDYIFWKYNHLFVTLEELRNHQNQQRKVLCLDKYLEDYCGYIFVTNPKKKYFDLSKDLHFKQFSILKWDKYGPYLNMNNKFKSRIDIKYHDRWYRMDKKQKLGDGNALVGFGSPMIWLENIHKLPIMKRNGGVK